MVAEYFSHDIKKLIYFAIGLTSLNVTLISTATETANVQGGVRRPGSEDETTIARIRALGNHRRLSFPSIWRILSLSDNSKGHVK